MALYHKCDVKNGFAYVLQFFSLIFDGLGGVLYCIALSLSIKLTSCQLNEQFLLSVILPFLEHLKLHELVLILLNKCNQNQSQIYPHQTLLRRHQNLK